MANLKDTVSLIEQMETLGELEAAWLEEEKQEKPRKGVFTALEAQKEIITASEVEESVDAEVESDEVEEVEQVEESVDEVEDESTDVEPVKEVDESLVELCESLEKLVEQAVVLSDTARNHAKLCSKNGKHPARYNYLANQMRAKVRQFSKDIDRLRSTI